MGAKSLLDDPEDVEKMLLHQEVGRGHRQVEMRTALVSHGIGRPQDFRSKYGQLIRLVWAQYRRQNRDWRQTEGTERAIRAVDLLLQHEQGDPAGVPAGTHPQPLGDKERARWAL